MSPKYLILIFLFCWSYGFTQEMVESQSRLSIGLNFSPNYSFRNLEYSDEFEWLAKQREHETASFGFNTGLVILYRLATRAELELNFQFSRQAWQLKDLPLINPNADLLGDGDYTYWNDYIEIPLRINYRFLNKKVFIFVTAGVSANISLGGGSKAELRFNSGTSEESVRKIDRSQFRSMVLAPVVGLGFGYNFNERWNVRVEPLFRYSLNPITDDNAILIKQYNHSIGLQTGLIMNL